MFRKTTFAMIAVAIILAACSQANPAPNSPLPEDEIPTAVVQYCGFSGLPQPRPETITGPNSEILPVKVWETWQVVPEDDDNPTDGLDPARCELHFEVSVARADQPDLVLNIHHDGPLGITATRGDESLEDLDTDDLMREMGLTWIRDLRLRNRTYVEIFWITANREYAVPRRLLTDEMLHFVISEVAVNEGIGDGIAELPLPEELQGLSGYNRVQLQEQCHRLSDMERGTKIFTCERLVNIFIDDATTPDIFDGTISLTVRPIGFTARRHAGAFYERGSLDPLAVIEQYGLVNLVKEYCQMTKVIIFRLNMYDGSESDLQATTCISP